MQRHAVARSPPSRARARRSGGCARRASPPCWCRRVLDDGVVRGREVGRTADERRQVRRQRVDRLDPTPTRVAIGAVVPASKSGSIGVPAVRAARRARRVASSRRPDGVGRAPRIEALAPRRVRGRAARAGRLVEARSRSSGTKNGRSRAASRGAPWSARPRRRRAARRGAGRVLLVGRAEADVRAHRDQRRPPVSALAAAIAASIGLDVVAVGDASARASRRPRSGRRRPR